MTRPAATRTARISSDDAPWISAGTQDPLACRQRTHAVPVLADDADQVGRQPVQDRKQFGQVAAADGRGEHGHCGGVHLQYQSVVVDLEQPDRALVEELAQVLQFLSVVPPRGQGVLAHRLRTARYCLGDPARASIRNRTGWGDSLHGQARQLGFRGVVAGHLAAAVHHDQPEPDLVDPVERNRLQRVQQ